MFFCNVLSQNCAPFHVAMISFYNYGLVVSPSTAVFSVRTENYFAHCRVPRDRHNPEAMKGIQ